MGLEVSTIAYIATAISVSTTVYTLIQASNQEEVGSKVQKRGVDAPRKVPYGRSIVDTVNVYNNVSNWQAVSLLKIFSIGVGEINAIKQVWVDDLALLQNHNTINPNTNPTYRMLRDNGDFVPAFKKQHIGMQFRYGQANENASEYAIAFGDGEWTTSHRGDRVPHIALVVNKSTDADTPILSPSYTLTALVEGVLVHDPRFHAVGVKEYEHSNNAVPLQNRSCGRNPAICLLDFLTDTYYGMGISSTYLNEQSFMDAANWTDSNGIFCDGAVDTGESYGDCISQIMSAFQGILVIENGLITCKYEDVVLVPYATTFDEDNIIEIKNIQNSTENKYYNIVETKYKNSIMSEKGDVYQLPQDINYIPVGQTKSRIEKDGFKKTKKLEMPMTVDNSSGTVTGAVKLFTNRLYIKALYQKGVTIAIDLKQDPVKVYDVIKISNKLLNWTNKLFRIKSINKSVDNDSFNVGELNCEEYNAEVYSGSLDGLTGRNRARIEQVLLDMTNLTFNLDNFVTDGYGTLSWTDPNPLNATKYVIEYKLSSEINWVVYTDVRIPTAKITGLKLDTYDFRVQAKKLHWYDSDYTELLNQTVSPTVTLPNVTNLSVDDQGMNFVFSWDDMSSVVVINPPDPTDPDSSGTTGKVSDYFKYYEVKIYHNNVFKKTYKTMDNIFHYLFEHNVANTLSRDIKAEVSIVAQDGSKSLLPTALSGHNNQMGLPANISINVLLGLANISWSPNTNEDFSGTEIHISSSPAFTPSLTTLADTLQAESTWQYLYPTNDITDKYIRIGHFDKFSTTGIVYSPSSLISTTKGFPVNDGIDGLDGSFTSAIYLNSPTQPNTPTGGSYNGTAETFPLGGWADDPTSPTGSDFIWVSRTKYSVDANGVWTNSGWSIAAKFSGDDGYTPIKGVDYTDSDYTSFLYVNSPTQPNTPTGGSYNGTAETFPTGGWADNPTYAAGQITWVTVTRYKQQSDLSWVGSPWSTPSKFYEVGNRGSVNFYRDISSSATNNAWSDVEADLAITSVGFLKGDRDQVTLYNQTLNFSETKFWDTVPATPLWVSVTQVIDGTLIVNGTIGANEIKVDEIFAQNITAQGIITGATLQTALSNASGTRVVMQNTTEPFQMWNGTNLIFGVDSVGNLSFAGSLADGTISNISMFSQEVLDLIMSNSSGSAGTGTGGVVSLSLGDISSGSFTSILEIPSINATPITISFTLTDNASRVSPAYIAPVWQVVVRENSSAGLIVHTGNYNGTSTTEADLNREVLFMDQSFSFQVGTAVAPSTGKYHIAVTKLSGDSVNAKLKSFKVAQAVEGGAYALPIATAGVLGGVKIGTGLSVDTNGLVTADTQTAVTWSTLSGKPSTFPASLTGNLLTAVPVGANFNNTTYSVGDNGLTAKNFTLALFNKLDGIATSANYITNNNQLTNGAGYITSYVNTQRTDEEIRDVIGLTIKQGGATTVTVNDAADTITISSTDTHVGLSDSVGSALSNVAATSYAVKLAYDLAAGKANASHTHATSEVTGLDGVLAGKFDNGSALTCSSISVTSSITYKNIDYREDIYTSLSDVIAIGNKGVAVGHYKKDEEKVTHNFFIAEEVGAVDENCVVIEDENPIAIKTNDLLAKAYAAIAALNAKVEELEAKVNGY